MRTPVVYPSCGGDSGANSNQDLKTGAYHDVAVGKKATSREIVLGSDPRLSDAREASDVNDWAKAPRKPKYTAEEVGAAELRHTHKLATINSVGFMSAEDKKLLTTFASRTGAVSKAKNNEIKELTDGLFVKTPSWVDKEW